MPDVGLTVAAEPLSPNLRVVIKYSVEVEGLPVYNETYDVEKLSRELKEDEARTLELWARRLRCAVACRDRSGFSASLTRCLVDGQCADFGFQEPATIDRAGVTTSA